MKTNLNNGDYNRKYFLQLMQAVLNGTTPKKPDKPVDWQVIYNIAQDHSLAGMLWYAVKDLQDSDLHNHPVVPYLKQMYKEQIVADLNLSIETERMLGELNKAGIRCIPMKGIVTKSDYPQPHLRTMSDVDILCDQGLRKSAEAVFLSNGYTKENVGDKDTSFRKDEILHYEIHSSLLNESSPAYSYFSGIWDRAFFDEGSNIAHMTLEDTYIFMLEHLAGHIEFGGAGIRMFMDVYLFLKNHENSLERSYIDKVLGEIMLSDFEKEAKSICHNWFSGEEEADCTSEKALFIFSSCTFGRSDVAFLSDALRNNKESTSAAKNGLERIAGRLFPPLKWMRLRFSAVDKLPLLYPVFVAVHWFERLFIIRNVNTSNIGNYFVTADSDEANKLKAIYTSLGLEKRI